MFGSFGSTDPFRPSSNSLYGQMSSNPFAQRPFGPIAVGSSTGSSMWNGIFGQQTLPASSSVPLFAASSVPLFGNSAPSVGTSSAPPCLFGGAPAATLAFGTTGFRRIWTQFPRGSRIVPYMPQLECVTDTVGSNCNEKVSNCNEKVISLSAMPVYKETSHEELRWEDYQLGDQGGRSVSAHQIAGGVCFPAPTQAGPVASIGVFGQPAAATPFSSGSSCNRLAPTTSSFGSSGFGSVSASYINSAFSASSSSPFVAPSFPTSVIGVSGAPAAFSSSSPSTFVGPTVPTFSFSPSNFGSSMAISSSSYASSSGFGSTQSSGPFQFAVPSIGRTSLPCEQSSFWGKRFGSRVASYIATYIPPSERESCHCNLESISAMPVYGKRSHEELRWEDYQHGDKGGPNITGQAAGGALFNYPPTAHPIFSGSPSNRFAPKTSTSTFHSPFGVPGSSPFVTMSSTPSLFGTHSAPAFAASTLPTFGASTTPAFSSSSSPFVLSTAGSSPAFGTSSAFYNSQSSWLFQPSAPSKWQTLSPFGNPAFGFQHAMPSLGAHTSSSPSTGFGGGGLANTAASLLPKHRQCRNRRILRRR